MSQSSAWRAGISAVKKSSDNIRQKFQEGFNNRCLIAHFDGKLVTEYTDGRKLTNNRCAVLISSPSIDAPQVLGVPVTLSASGANQETEIVKLLKEWNVWEYLFGLSFDTTADNTGKRIGACTLIEKEAGLGLLWLACRHHVKYTLNEWPLLL